MTTHFNLDATIKRRAAQVFEHLLNRGGHRDCAQARKYAAAAKSWCQLNPEIGATSGQLHSRRKGGATWRLWQQVIMLSEASGELGPRKR